MASHLETAQARIEEIRAMRQQIPNLTFPSSTSETRRLSPAASVSKEFVELTLLAVKNSQHLVRVGGPDPVQVRDIVSYAEAYEPLAAELEALAAFLRHSITAAMNKVGHDALTTYAFAQRLATRPETADLAPMVREMRKALGTRGRKARPVPAAITPDNPGPIMALTTKRVK